MQILDAGRKAVKPVAFALAVSTLVGLSGCTLDQQPDPVLRGPSELALSFLMTARPDLVATDGVSTSAINVVLRDRDALPLPNRLIYFAVCCNGRVTSSYSTTDANGVAGTTYVAPSGSVGGFPGEVFDVVEARTVDSNHNDQVYRFVSIELRSPGP
jgi:hypothetical protein